MPRPVSRKHDCDTRLGKWMGTRPCTPSGHEENVVVLILKSMEKKNNEWCQGRVGHVTESDLTTLEALWSTGGRGLSPCRGTLR